MRKTNEPEHWVEVVSPLNSATFSSTQQYMWKCKCGDWDDGFDSDEQVFVAAMWHLKDPASPMKYGPDV